MYVFQKISYIPAFPLRFYSEPMYYLQNKSMRQSSDQAGYINTLKAVTAGDGLYQGQRIPGDLHEHLYLYLNKQLMSTNKDHKPWATR